MTIEFRSAPYISDTSEVRLFGTFGELRDRTNGDLPHQALDFSVGVGTTVLAVSDGTVVESSAYNGYGINVIIKHDSGFFSRYAHLATKMVDPGDRVRAGKEIGTSGATPTPSTNPHLHFDIKEGRGTWGQASYRDPALPLQAYYNRTRSGNVLTLDENFKEKTSTGAVALASLIANRDSISRITGGIIRLPDGSLATPGASTTTPGRPSAPSGTHLSPYIAAMGSFHPKIQYELTRRNFASETANVYTPFVKLTSLSNVLSDNLRSGDVSSLILGGGQLGIGTRMVEIKDVYCPTLGPHGEPEISFEDIYTPQDGRSIVGYATKQGKRVPVVVASAEADPPNIPMPGIESVTTERSTAGPFGVRGGLFKANLKIVAHSVGQLNTLLRYFLRPATRVILEIGRKSSSDREQEINWFNWKQSREEIEGVFGDIIRMKKDQRELLTKYIYNNYGNYELFIGYVVNFKLKYGGKNTYQIDLTIHSVQQFEVPVKITGARSLCTTSILDENKVSDIEQYFDPNANWIGNSFGKLMAKALDNTLSGGLNADVIPLKGIGADTSATAQPGYLVTWQFFTDIILNDATHGLMSIFQLQPGQDNAALAVLKKSMLREFQAEDLDIQKDKLVNAQVSWHEHLRSTDPSVMVIHNPRANRDNTAAIQSLKASGFVESDDISDSQISDKINPTTSFDQLAAGENVSSLFTGVWINTNAIKEAFSSADTISTALERLLNAMNSATQGFWNLQLLSNDQESPGVHVVDMGLSKPNNQSLKPREDSNLTGTIDNRAEEVAKFQSGDAVDESKYLYMFNRKIQTFDKDDLGGELLDISIEAGLPQVVAVQAIAGVGGVAQKGTMAAIDMDELRQITLFKDIYPKCPPSGSNIAPLNDRNTIVFKSGLTFDVVDEYARKSLESTNESMEANPVAVEAATEIAVPRTSSFQATRRQRNDMRPKVKADIEARMAAIRGEVVQQYHGLINLTKGYANAFGSAINLIEWDRTRLMKLLTEGKEDETIHPFNSSNLTKTVVDLTMPGIGGIQLFQAFVVDRVPNVIDRGYFIVTKINHDFSVEKGWTTKIQGRFRFKPSKPETEPT